jgi:hypothetical protein
MKRAVKRTAIALFSAAVLIGAAETSQWYVEDKHRQLVRQAEYYADTDGLKAYNEEEQEAACVFILEARIGSRIYNYDVPKKRKKKLQSEIKKECKGKRLWEMTNGQLEYFIRRERGAAMGDFIGRHMMSDADKRFERGEFDDRFSDKMLRLANKYKRIKWFLGSRLRRFMFFVKYEILG